MRSTITKLTAVVAVLLHAAPLDADAQGRIYRLGILEPAAPPPAGTHHGRRVLIEVQALGLTIPRSLLLRADQVIE